MLQLNVPDAEYFDEENQRFITVRGTNLALEHSLVSLSKWESIHCKPFLVDKPPKTTDEWIDYVRCMTITQNVPDYIYYSLTDDNWAKINDYINAPMTATTFGGNPKKGKKEIVTAEILYYDMIAFNIPFECQRWHLNRLMTLIHVCSIKNSTDKLSKRETYDRQRSINARNRRK